MKIGFKLFSICCYSWSSHRNEREEICAPYWQEFSWYNCVTSSISSRKLRIMWVCFLHLMQHYWYKVSCPCWWRWWERAMQTLLYLPYHTTAFFINFLWALHQSQYHRVFFSSLQSHITDKLEIHPDICQYWMQWSMDYSAIVITFMHYRNIYDYAKTL